MQKISSTTPSSQSGQRKRRNYFLWILILIILALGFYLSSLNASNEGEWTPLQAQLPTIQITEQNNTTTYHINHVRDFRYAADQTITQNRYLTEIYALEDLQQVWLGISHFGGKGLAHTFLSFEFSGNRFLAASVEARLHSEQHYNPVFGLFRQYAKMVVLATEQDVIGLRTHIRHEKVLLYPLRPNSDQQQFVFKSIMADAQAISQKADFYNTLLDNCATNLLKYDPDYRFYTSLLDYRLLLPGFSDEVAQEKGWIDANQSLLTLREQATINPENIDVSADNFSELVRQSWKNK